MICIKRLRPHQQCHRDDVKPWLVTHDDPKGVFKLLNGLNINKASGPDCLSARVLKECSSEIAPILTLI